MKVRSYNISNFNFKKNTNGRPILSKMDIDAYAQTLVNDFRPELLKNPGPMPIDEFIELYLNLTVDYQKLSTDGKTLGMIAFNNGYVQVYDDQNNTKMIEVEEGTIFIDNALIDNNNQNGRCRFTLAHEPGHWIFHRHMYIEEVSSFRVPPGRTKVCHKCLKKDIGHIGARDCFTTDDQWQEWQADYFASAILMPEKIVKELFFAILSGRSEVAQKNAILNIGVDAHIYEMAKVFQVSYSAMKIRLFNLGLTNDGTFCLNNELSSYY